MGPFTVFATPLNIRGNNRMWICRKKLPNSKELNTTASGEYEKNDHDVPAELWGKHYDIHEPFVELDLANPLAEGMCTPEWDRVPCTFVLKEFEDGQRDECEVYLQLRELQDKCIPKFFGETSWKDYTDPDETTTHQAMLLEYLAGYYTLAERFTLDKSIHQGFIDALESIGEAGICHGDVAARNLMYQPDTKEVRVIDFELSKKNRETDILRSEKWGTELLTMTSQNLLEFECCWEESVEDFLLGILRESAPTKMGGVILYYQNNPQSQCILWLFEELADSYNLGYIAFLHMRHPKYEEDSTEFVESNPQGCSPKILGAGGDPICPYWGGLFEETSYILGTYDTSHKFVSADGVRNDRLCKFACTSLLPIRKQQLLGLVQSEQIPEDSHEDLFSHVQFKKYLLFMESELGEREWFNGERVGQSDFVMIWPMETVAASRDVDLEREYPTLFAWRKRVQERPAWKRAVERRNGRDVIQLN
ncbi:glutathione S-transferase [Drepanopeziza brunnea f. sp. 'multigermtubi' MB_m1]|uniref:non-specific serine/threonine protein kinase n=2 Tax=Drepanopeziza brunnea f. sp. 'multigermtubi' TaxID=698441 RepID=K1X7C7_MARBU|nr:glutathione S-transferase [Drepanopeziza brunnea f. sp. 'multigermtubi' MB_m1]EKD21006.1 glutathione S-transferase [Drepanopeziza brunnea f. sp. 'multigermtubi' MB_m1]